MADSEPRHRAVFLDRDGTLIHDPGYLSNPEGVRLLDGVADGLRALQGLGFELVIVTNQSGIARGKYTVAQYEEVAARVLEQLEAEGVSIRASYFCPYHPDGVVAPYDVEHEDRKPNDGMWRRAATEHPLDLARSYSIGDGERDVVAGKRAGTRAVLLAGGRDKWPLPVKGPFDPDFVARDFREAVLWILKEEHAKLPDAPGGTLLA
ncbi:MAG: HAD family hydrolase [Planctomycetota bacterium]|nr:HAD family hydrolase [Planctomycetota bacterium]